MEKIGIKIKVKWGKNDYSVEVEPSTDKVCDLKVKLMSLTNVPVDKQKVIFKGTTLTKDDALLNEYKLSEGSAVLLMGSAEENAALTQPLPEKKFIEEMTKEEKAKFAKEVTGEALPFGLKNLGNTCYMNASLQCLRRINEFKDALIAYGNKGGRDA